MRTDLFRHATHKATSGVTQVARGMLSMSGLLLVMAGCSTAGDSVTQPKNNVATIPWSLDLNYNAILMSVGQQVKLETAAHTLAGSVITGIPPVVFTSTDTVVKIDANGNLTASAARANVIVVATVQDLNNNWTIADTLRVMVTPTPVAFNSYKMEFTDSPVTPAGRTRTFTARLYDAGGNVITIPTGPTTTSTAPVTYYESLALQSVFQHTNRWTGSGTGRNLGDVTLRARSLIYGTTYQDSLKLKVTYSDSSYLYIYRVSTTLTPSPSMMSQTDLTVLQNGKVLFRNNNTTLNADIVFDDLANVVGGNIPVVPVSPATPAVVIFPNLGKFTYKSSLGFTGTITVVARPTL